MEYRLKKNKLLQQWQTLDSHTQIHIQKKTASNLFRYQYAPSESHSKAVSLKDFNTVIGIDPVQQTLDVEALTTFEAIVHYTLPKGYLPEVTPELKHITIGGAIVGIGIESTCYKYGFVHDSLLEAEVLLPTGKIVLCTPTNEYSDLFFALPNSYGTLGYLLRVKIRLRPVKPFVHVAVSRFNTSQEYLNAMEHSTADPKIDFVEGLIFGKEEFYLMQSRFVEKVSSQDDIYHQVFYHLCQTQKDIYLNTEDYIFRYDPDWFWNLPETPLYQLLRRLLPRRWRHSGFYKKYSDRKARLLSLFIQKKKKQEYEPLIQDWEVPWDKAKEFLDFALTHVDLGGKPWAALPIKPLHNATLYPMQKVPLYFNLGSYCPISKPKKIEEYYYTKILDQQCFALGGIKMLYSSTFISKADFDAIYNGRAYSALKKKYDPSSRLPDLYQKTSGV